MAKQVSKTEKGNLPVLSEDQSTIDITQRFDMPLFRRIQKFQQSINASTEQEAIRIGMHLLLKRNGF